MKSVDRILFDALPENLGKKYASFYSVKMYTCATCEFRYSVGFSPLVHTCPAEAKE